MRSPVLSLTLALMSGLLLAGCRSDAVAPTAGALVPSMDGSEPLTPRVDLNVTLQGEGHGHIKFRQPEDLVYIAFLDTKVVNLTPYTGYQLQRATDPVLDDNCTGENWIPLGQVGNPSLVVIHTDRLGKGEVEFSRDLSRFAGAEFDIYFRIIDVGTGAVVLQSGCYQFKVSQ